MITCSKKYTDLPFAHRQPHHTGHCSLIHGHNWSFEFTFASTERDACGFVVDFGKLKWLRAWLERRFDHTLLLNNDDPRAMQIRGALLPSDLPSEGNMNPETLAKIVMVEDCSCEGIAIMVFEAVNRLISEKTKGRVRVLSLTVFEDEKNSAKVHG